MDYLDKDKDAIFCIMFVCLKCNKVDYSYRLDLSCLKKKELSKNSNSCYQMLPPESLFLTLTMANALVVRVYFLEIIIFLSFLVSHFHLHSILYLDDFYH